MDNIKSVLELTYLLAFKRDQLKSSNEFNKINEELKNKFKISEPKYKKISKHEIQIDFYFIHKSDLPEKSTLLKIINFISQKLYELDRRFNQDMHLTVKFTAYPNNILVSYKNGDLIRIK